MSKKEYVIDATSYELSEQSIMDLTVVDSIQGYGLSAVLSKGCYKNPQ